MVFHLRRIRSSAAFVRAEVIEFPSARVDVERAAAMGAFTIRPQSLLVGTGA